MSNQIDANSIVLKKEKQYYKILFGIALLSILMILSLSSISFYNNGDDYSFLNELKKNGVLNNAVIGYNTWDGRFLSLTWLLQQVAFVYCSVQTMVFFWSLCFLLSGFLLFYSISNESTIGKISQMKKTFIILFLTLLFWLGSVTHFSQTIYWATGGVYSFNLFIGALWIVLFLKFQKEEFNKFQKGLYVLFSLIVGATTINLAIGLITLVLLTLWIDYLSKNKQKNNFNFMVLALLTIGFLFILVAPGNFVRAAEINKMNGQNELSWNVISNYFSVLFLYLKWSSILIFLSVLGGIVFIWMTNRNIEFKFKYSLLGFLNQTKWLWVALSTITPFVALPTIASPRTVIYFMYFLIIFIVLMFLNFSKESSVNTKFLKQKSAMAFFMSFIILGISIWFIGYNFEKGIVLKNAIAERDALLQESKNKIVYLKPLNPNLNSFCYKFIDYEVGPNDKTNWIIENLEEYYNTKIVIAK
jgi:hypothetical protein